MAASHETEIKLAVSDLQAMRRRLRALGFRVAQPRRFESNRLFDFPDSRLRKKSCLVRLRNENGEALVTFKGPPLASNAYKVRPEVETQVADGGRIREIFAGLGLEETFRYEKYRTTFARRRDRARAPGAVVELDETPIGAYLELEGPGGWIDAVTRELGFRRQDYITASYAALYFERCRREGLRPCNMVFRRRNK